ncbi:hypothetical protein niasHT_032700 [Heterodera trifolii]|uniref:BTB domain-containing protein n=1 Tax=Heterodera trifolii TaxID=157864 RepID=A0ABD2IDT0_9BILA
MGPNRRGPIDPVRFLFIQAHKVILKRASDVFGVRFDAKKEKTENISAESLVVIPDIEAQAFKVMLSFIYAEDLSELNGDNVMAVLFVVPSGVLTMEEFVGVYQFHCHPNFSGLPGLYPLHFQAVAAFLTGRKGDLFWTLKNFLNFPFFTTCEHLMDPDKGFYDKDEDKVTMSIEIAVKEQKGTKRKLSDE